MIKACEHFIQFFRTPIALMLMGLDTDHVNRHTGIQAAVNQDFIVRGGVEIIDQQRGIRVGFMGRRKHTPHQFHAAQLLADTRDGIIVFVKDRHDDDFVNDVPHIDHALKKAHVAADTGKLTAQDFFVGILHQPVSADRVPAQRMPLQGNAAGFQPFRRLQSLPSQGFSLYRFKVAPVKRESCMIKQF